MPDPDDRKTVTERVRLALAAGQQETADRIAEQDAEEEEDDDVD